MEKKYRVITNGEEYKVQRLFRSFWGGEKWVTLDRCSDWDNWYAEEYNRPMLFRSEKEVKDFIKRDNWRISQEIVV